MSNARRTSSYPRIAVALLSLCVLTGLPVALALQGSEVAPRALDRLAWSTDAIGPRRFVAVHGRYSAVFGYSQNGLEVWAGPLQVLHSYAIAFRQQGTTTEIDGQAVLRRIVYRPEAVTRIYVGPDFIVREKIFVPLEMPGAIITYETAGERRVDIVIRFAPSLDLMWPASIGGQEAAWDPDSSAYRLSEPTGRFASLIGSPDIVAHDDTANATLPLARSPGLAFTLRSAPGRGAAQVVIAGSASGQDPKAIAMRLLAESAPLQNAAVAHYADLLEHALEIETPDPDINRALAWSAVALDQAWACAPDLGCAEVAGFGPSRKARRPQYDWFFAGDGMVAVRALLATGQYTRARQELEFIMKFQDRKTGMIWHELTQSAAELDWAKYPYLYVHVDLSFDFLDIVAQYFARTGDLEFISRHWESLQSAYHYCRSVLDPNDGLPRIPADKQAGNEQDALTDELSLSASWVTAARAFGELAAATGRRAEAKDARRASQRALEVTAKRYWDEHARFWISGFTRSGTPLVDRDLHPAPVLARGLFSPSQQDLLLDQLAAPDFQTDWGTRSKAASARTYNPNLYSSGSVWALGTAEIATAFWNGHRPVTALPVWSSLVPWTALDSLGHMHEVLAGDLYHEELESVPEQTWSSASFLSATVDGLLGLKVDGRSNSFTLAPHIPADWNTLTLQHVRVGTSELAMNITRSEGEIRLEVANKGASVALTFDPEIPFGATQATARLEDRPIVATLQQHPQDTHARMDFTLPPGRTVLTLRYSGGIALIAPRPRPVIGESSQALRISDLQLTNSAGRNERLLTMDVDYATLENASFILHTPWKLMDLRGARFQAIAPALYRVTLNTPADSQDRVYRRVRLLFSLAD